MSAMIDIRGLNKFYRDGRLRKTHAVKDVSFAVEEGEAFGFVGPNGAGKSSTIKIIVGVSNPSSGVVSLFGKSVSDPRSRVGVAYVPENPSLYDYLTPLEILKMGARFHHLRVPDMSTHCMQWLERFRISHVANKPIRLFSKGMVQRTALAQALAVNPRLLILDEPLSGLDPIGRKEVVDILVEYRKRGGSTFFSSHVLHDVERLADRFGLIHQGRLQTVQRPDELVGGKNMVVIRSVGSSIIEGMSQDTASRWSVECEASNAWMWLNKIQQSGHQILEVKPSMTLESAFLSFVTSNG